jgi:hypothetical protein
VIEGEILDTLLTVIQREFLKPANLEALKKEVRRQEQDERNGKQRPAAALERQIAQLTRKIDAGTTKWLTAPPSLTSILGEKLEQWRVDLERLQAEKRELAKPAASVDDLDAAVETIVAGLATLRTNAGNAPASMLREALRKMVEKVELWFKHVPYGPKRTKSMLERGLVHLRDELIVSRPFPLADLSLSGYPRRP